MRHPIDTCPACGSPSQEVAIARLASDPPDWPEQYQECPDCGCPLVEGARLTCDRCRHSARAGREWLCGHYDLMELDDLRPGRLVGTDTTQPAWCPLRPDMERERVLF